jgi:hypothetical protein
MGTISFGSCAAACGCYTHWLDSSRQRRRGVGRFPSRAGTAMNLDRVDSGRDIPNDFNDTFQFFFRHVRKERQIKYR